MCLLLSWFLGDEPLMSDEVLTLGVRQMVDATIISANVRKFAEQNGFPQIAQWEIAIAVSEAITNMVKYAGQGWLRLQFVAGSSPYLEVLAEDEGQGIEQVQQALLDGFSEGRHLSQTPYLRHDRGLGLGLGTMKRLMDELAIERPQPGGTRLRMRKYLRAPAAARAMGPTSERTLPP